MTFRIIALFSVAFSACNIFYRDADRPRQITEGLPGTIFLRDSLWLDRYEISNADWREYIAWTAREYGIGSAEYRASMPDSAFWFTRSDLSSEPLHESYFREPKYNEYPVTGISYEQAVAYCQWRTERVKEAVCMTPSEKAGMPKDFTYRLPTSAEWEYAASAGFDPEKSPYGFENIRTRSKQYKMVTKETPPPLAHHEYSFGFPGKTVAPNRYGFYDLIGNAAEMVAERGIAKGGSYAHKLEECRVKTGIRYDQPMPWLGFRCICVVKK